MSLSSESLAATSDRRRGHDSALRDLIAVKIRLLAPMIFVYMAAYVGLTALAGFARGFVALKVAGPLNLGFALIALNYGLSWSLALVYVHFANTIFDPMVEEAVARRKRRGAVR
jgi:uncharacterized membrane protein (DUF485 family)